MSCAAPLVSPAWALTLQYQPLAYRLARDFARSKGLLHSLEDLKQEALLGMHRGAERYESARGVAFATWATLWVQAALNESYRLRSGAPVAVPRPAFLKGERTRGVSFDAPARGDEDDGRALANTLPSPDRWQASAEARVDAARLMARAAAHSPRQRHPQLVPQTPLRDIEAYFRMAQGESGQEIGNEVHVSRERVRQLAGRGGALLRQAAGLSRAGG